MIHASRNLLSINSVNLLVFRLVSLAVFLFAPLFIQTSAAQTSPSNDREIESILYKHGEVIVRVNFDDADQARKFGLGLEPMQSDYQKGYLVFHLTAEEYSTLRSVLAGSGMSMELDQALTRQYITHFKPRTRQLRSAQDTSPGQLSQMMTSPLDVSNYPTIPGFACYRTVEGTFETAQDIVSGYPNLATWTDAGDSWEKGNLIAGSGYDLMVLKLTNSEIAGPKPKVFFTSSIHAREYTTAELMTRFAAQLVENYGKDADTTWVLDHHEIHLMLSTNPDGRKQAETGLLWRKNTNQNYCGPTSNNRGADLNRNFSFEWNCCGGSSTNQCNATFHGSGPASEPEAQAVISYLRSNFPDTRGPGSNDAADLNTMGLYIDVHSSGRLILWPWGSTSNLAPNSTQLQTLGRKLAFFNGHEPKQSIGLYPTDGTTTSFAYGDLGLPAYTYELGTQFFETCSYFENTLLPDNLPSLAYLIKTARQPYVLPAGPDVINQSVTPTSPAGVPSGTQVTLGITATDQRFNNTNGAEPTQNVVSAEYYLDSPPWSVTPPASNPMSVVDGSANSPVEEFDAIIDTSGFSQGRHTIYIRATDQSGSTGVVSALFVDIDDSAVLPVTVFSDDFETDLGWQTDPSGTDTATTGQWARADPEETSANGGAQQLGTTVSGSFDLVTGPLAGTSAGTHDIDNGVTSIRSPAIDLPVSSSIALSFQSYMAHLNNATTADFFRASITDGATTSVVFQELGEGDQDNAAWQLQSADITIYSGKTITILFEAADAATGSLVEAAVDDVEIIAVLENQPPVVTNPGDRTDVENTAVSLQIDATDLDQPLAYSATGMPDGLSINTTTGLIDGTLTATPQVFNTSVTVADSEGNETTVNFTWTITVDNAAPDVTNPGMQSSDEDTTIAPLQINADDTDGDQLFYSETGLPPGLTIDQNSGVISGTLDFNSAGSYSVEVEVTDNIAISSVAFIWTVNNVNRAPVFNQQIASQSDNEGESVSLSASAGDPDGDSLMYSATGLPDGISINAASGSISGILSADSSGSYTVTVTATEINSGNLMVMQSFDWTVADVNLPPIISSPGNQSDQQNNTVSLQIVADDPESATLTYSDTSASLPAGLSINSSTGVISGTVNAAVGSYPVTIEVSDGPNQASTSFAWTVTQVSANQQLIYVSSTTGGSVGGVSFADEDILTFNTATGAWEMYLDGSDVGLSGSSSRDINAFTMMNDGSVIFSVIGATTLPDVGAIDDSDLIHFIPGTTGSSTSGTFELYFDGSDVGLTNGGEDIDSVSLLSDGTLLIGTIGSFSVPGVSGRDEDLLVFTPTSLGASTSGSWAIYFDGSDVGLSTTGSEDVYAAWLDESNDDIYLSTQASFSVSGLSGDGADIFVCSPVSIGSTTNCNFSLFWDGGAFGYGSESIDGLFIE